MPGRSVRVPGGLEALRALVMASSAGGTAMPGRRAEEWSGPASAGTGSTGHRPGKGAGPDGAGPADPEQERVLALVQLAQHGDREAYAQIYDRYVDSVYRYVRYRVGSPALAEDLTSETFLRGLRGLGQFHWQGRDIGAWFTTIARNLINDHVKSSRFRLEMTTADMLDLDRADGDVETTVLSRLESRRLLEAVHTLRPDQQECIVLRFLQGLSLAETAQVLGRSEGAVKQLQLRAVRRLAQVLGGSA